MADLAGKTVMAQAASSAVDAIEANEAFKSSLKEVVELGDYNMGFMELAQGSGTELHLDVDGIALIPEALELAAMGILPEGMYRNRAFAEESVDPGEVELARQDMLYDPQTSGGLLMAVDPADADALFAELLGAVPAAQRIGTVEAYRGGKRIFLR